ncbi:hypothetical protein BU15DRAFT_72734 [Melanogaster broomeanus]|nr:hypothetical protein BU15DRAFT_72734 [Melanogaster broomeanus]
MGREQLPESAEREGPSIRRQLIQQFHNILKEQQGHAVTTGAERSIRWTGSTTHASVGNVGNAAVVSRNNIRKAMERRKKVFTTAKMPLLATITGAGINGTSALSVITLYSKGGGKNGKHSAVTRIDSVAGVSYFAVQIFEQQFQALFTAIPAVTAPFQCRQFALIPSTAFFTVLLVRPSDSKTIRGGIELDLRDLTTYVTLTNAENQIKEAAKGFRRRDNTNQTQRDDEDSS